MRKLFRIDKTHGTNQPPLPGIFPRDQAPIVRKSGDGSRVLVQMRWGFVLKTPGMLKDAVTNARSDKVAVSSFWKQSFHERRCLVPATSFAEWTDWRPKVCHWFALGEDRPLFAFAGIWRHWKGELKDNPVEFDCFSLLTTSANAVTKPIHSKAMPVILDTEEAYDTWMDGTPDEALRLARPYPDKGLKIVLSGPREDK